MSDIHTNPNTNNIVLNGQILTKKIKDKTN